MKQAIATTVLSCFVFGLVVAQEKCGIPDIKPDLNDLHIIGGKEAIPGSWPWHVGLYMRQFFGDSHFCAGALIDDRTVVTAAHCLATNKNNVRIHLGAHIRSGKDDGQIEVGVAHFCSHWLYGSMGGNTDDIGIIRLATPVKFTQVIKPICLPPEKDEVRIGKDEVFVTGWGYTSSGWDREQSEHLKQAKQKIITKSECRAMRQMDVTKVICSKHDLGSSCHGDSGGPLVLQREGQWQLQGVVSGGPPVCGTKDWPMYYTEVSKYLDWIKKYKASADPFKTSNLCKERQ